MTRLVVPGWRAVPVFLAACLLGLAAASAAQEPELTPEQYEALHRGMLELRQMERNGDRAGAIRRGEDLLNQFPDSRRVEEALLNLYRVEGRDEALMKILRRRLTRDADAVDAARELAAILLARNRTGEATDVLAKSVAANPRDENRYRLAASLLRSRGAVDAAIQFLRDGRRAVGQEGLFAAELAQLEEARGDLAAALGEYVLLAMEADKRGRAWREIAQLLDRIQDPSPVVSRLESLRKQHPRAPAVHDVAALVFLRAGRLQEALAAVREADRYADDQGEHLLDFGRAALQPLGGESVAPERAGAGVRALELLSERHPQSNLIPEATKLAAEGLVSVARGQPPGPQRDELLQQAVRSIDASAGKLRSTRLEIEARALKALILFDELGRAEEALDVFRGLAARQREVGDPDEIVRVQEALCLAALGRLDEARSVLESVAGAASPFPPAALPPGHKPPPTPADIGRSRARYHMAELDLIAGRYDQARDGFAALAEEAPEDRLANDCLDLALTLVESEGDDPAALGRLGAYRRARLLRDAATMRAELEAVVRDHAQAKLVPVCLFELAALHEAGGQHAQAQERYEAILARHAQHRLAPRALEAIGDLQMQHLGRPDLAVASYERLLLEFADDLFLDGVRKKLLEARAAAKGAADATP